MKNAPDHTEALPSDRRQRYAAKVPPLASRAEVIVSEVVEDALDTVKRASGLRAKKVAAAEFAAEVAEGRASYGTLLARVWKEAKRTIEDIERSDDMPVAKRVATLHSLSKLMPLLAKAEENYVAKIGKRRIEDMTDSQLERELRHVRRQRRRK